MAYDLATAIVSLATELKVQDDKEFMKRTGQNHYIVDIDIYSRDGYRIKKEASLGSKSFYNVDGQVFLPVDNIISPTRFINFTKNSTIILPLLIQHFTHTYKDITLDNSWTRASIAIPILDVYTFNTNISYIKSFNKIEVWDYDDTTHIEKIVKDCIGYISCIENKKFN